MKNNVILDEALTRAVAEKQRILNILRELDFALEMNDSERLRVYGSEGPKRMIRMIRQAVRNL